MKERACQRKPTLEHIRPILGSETVALTKTKALCFRVRIAVFAFKNYLWTIVKMTMTMLVACSERLMHFWSKFSDVMPARAR